LFDQSIDAGFIINDKERDLNGIEELSFFDFVRRPGIEYNPAVGNKGTNVFSGDIANLAGEAPGGGVLLEIAYKADSAARRARGSYTAGV